MNTPVAMNKSEARKKWHREVGFSEEARQKISKAQRGKKLSKKTRMKISEGLRGRPVSSETRKKMSEMRRGKKLSKEHRRKISEAHMGKTLSDKTKRKIGKAGKGRAPWNVGKTGVYSQETLQKMRKAQKGEKHYNWKGGITPLVKQIRKCFKSRQWRSDIFTRDDFTCVECGERGRYLEADHYPKSFIEIFREHNIKSLEDAICCEEFWNINNGRTLCSSCHNLTKGRNRL